MVCTLVRGGAHAKEMVVSRVDWTETEGTLDVNLGHQGPASKVHDRVDGIIDGGVAQRDPYAIVDAIPWGVREVHNKAPLP